MKKALETYSGNLTEENANSLEETRKVGAYSNETIIDGVREFEILATLKSPPKTTDIEAVAVSLTESLPNFNISCEPDSAMIKCKLKNNEIFSNSRHLTSIIGQKLWYM